MKSITPTTIKKPMRKWCHTCEVFKPNPLNRKNPRYCEDCLTKISIRRLEKRDLRFKK